MVCFDSPVDAVKAVCVAAFSVTNFSFSSRNPKTSVAHANSFVSHPNSYAAVCSKSAVSNALPISRSFVALNPGPSSMRSNRTASVTAFFCSFVSAVSLANESVLACSTKSGSVISSSSRLPPPPLSVPLARPIRPTIVGRMSHRSPTRLADAIFCAARLKLRALPFASPGVTGLFLLGDVYKPSMDFFGVLVPPGSRFVWPSLESTVPGVGDGGAIPSALAAFSHRRRNAWYDQQERVSRGTGNRRGGMW